MKKLFRRNSKGGSATDRTSNSDEGDVVMMPTTTGHGNHNNSNNTHIATTAGASPTPNRKSIRLFPSLLKKNNNRDTDDATPRKPQSPSSPQLPTIVLENFGGGLLDTPRSPARSPPVRGGMMFQHHSNVQQLGPPSPSRASLFQWQDEMEALQKRRELEEKRDLKTRDGFCRRVSHYDGAVIEVDGTAAYELGNYLGGGVAGVVYEGHRLRPLDEYPVRMGRVESYLEQQQQHQQQRTASSFNHSSNGTVVIQVPRGNSSSGQGPPGVPPVESINLQDFLCLTSTHAVDDGNTNNHMVIETTTAAGGAAHGMLHDRVSSLLTDDGNASVRHNHNSSHTNHNHSSHHTAGAVRDQEMALEATVSTEQGGVLIDTVDAPSRSKHYARASCTLPDDVSLTGAMEETVAVKVLNPVGFRLLNEDVTNSAVVARAGMPLPKAVLRGEIPMEEKHVWWLVNPNSRNLRTLQRYTADNSGSGGSGGNAQKPGTSSSSRRVEVDRGSSERGLRISLVAAYQEDGVLKELPLTRCIEIWGHVPFGATDSEFKTLMSAIDRINQGQSPAPVSSIVLDSASLSDLPPGRVGTGVTESSHSSSLDEPKSSGHPMVSKRTYVGATN